MYEVRFHGVQLYSRYSYTMERDQQGVVYKPGLKTSTHKTVRGFHGSTTLVPPREDSNVSYGK